MENKEELRQLKADTASFLSHVDINAHDLGKTDERLNTYVYSL